jgi:hypothetical protein
MKFKTGDNGETVGKTVEPFILYRAVSLQARIGLMSEPEARGPEDHESHATIHPARSWRLPWPPRLTDPGLRIRYCTKRNIKSI